MCSCDPQSGAEDRALLGSNPSAVPAQGQGATLYLYYVAFSSILSLAQRAKSQGPGDRVPGTTEEYTTIGLAIVAISRVALRMLMRLGLEGAVRPDP
jgi:hypothetical protein